MLVYFKLRFCVYKFVPNIAKRFVVLINTYKGAIILNLSIFSCIKFMASIKYRFVKWTVSLSNRTQHPLAFLGFLFWVDYVMRDQRQNCFESILKIGSKTAAAPVQFAYNLRASLHIYIPSHLNARKCATSVDLSRQIVTPWQPSIVNMFRLLRIATKIRAEKKEKKHAWKRMRRRWKSPAKIQRTFAWRGIKRESRKRYEL